MFKKPRDADTKAEKKFGGKEIKSCIATLNARFPSENAENTGNLSKKSNLSLKFLVAASNGNQDAGILFNGENEPLFVVSAGGKGFPDKVNSDEPDAVYPTLLTLWRHSCGEGIELFCLEKNHDRHSTYRSLLRLSIDLRLKFDQIFITLLQI